MSLEKPLRMPGEDKDILLYSIDLTPGRPAPR